MGRRRIKGNTDLLLDEALRGAASQAAEIEKLVVDKLNITPCREYYACVKDGNCVIRDDMDGIYPQLLSADRIIIASPMFFYSLTAQVKALLDRCQVHWARKYVLTQDMPNSGRKGSCLAVVAPRGEPPVDGTKLHRKYDSNSLIK